MINVGTGLILLLGTDNKDGTFTGVASGTSQAIDCKPYDELTFYLEVDGGTISGGTILVEEASRASYTGQWSQVQSITGTTLSGTAQQQAIHIAPNSFGAVRMRISSALTGGGKALLWMIEKGS